MIVKKTSTDYDLIDMFSDEHNAFAREAFIAFHERHASFIFNSSYSFVSENQYINDYEAAAKDLSQLVFERIIKSVTKFRKQEGIAQREIVYHVRGWIYKIIGNIFNDEYVKKQNSRPKLVRVEDDSNDLDEYNLLEKNQNAILELSSEKKEKYGMIIKAMENIKLSDKEIDVLRVYIESGWFDENNNWILPQERMQELMDKYNIKKNSIIQCKTRLVNKIKKLVLS